MIPVKNKFANKTLTPPLDDLEREYKFVKDIRDLPVWTDDKQCISEWRLSFRERLSALIFGKVWLSILSGSTQPPVYLTAERNHLRYFEEGE